MQETVQHSIDSEAEDSSNLIQWRKKIITNILNDGLKAARTLKEDGTYLGSVDQEIKGMVYDNHLFGRKIFEDDSDFLRSLNESLYDPAEGSLTIITERFGEIHPYFYWLRGTCPTDEIRKLWQERMNSSFFVVVDDLSGMREEEIRQSPILKEIPPYRFSYLLIPSKIYDELGNINSNVPIKPIRKTRSKYFSFAGAELTIPDYEGFFVKTLSKNTTDDILWIHGVRLPTEEDLKRLNTLTNL